MHWGLVVPVIGSRWETIEADVAFAERAGVDSVWIWDHLMGTRDPTADVFEAWTSLASMAALTSTVRVGHLVTCVSYRNVGLLAKMATTVDHISGGRLDLGLGAGWYEAEYEAFGYVFPGAGERRKALEEAVEALRLLFRGGPVHYDGDHVQLDGARCDPLPVQSGGPPIMIGAGGPLMRRLAGTTADAWTCPARILPHLDDAIASVLEAANDRPIRITANIPVVVGVDEADALAARSAASPELDWMGDIDAVGVVGTIPEAVEKVRLLADAGIDGLQCQVPTAGRRDRLQAFAELMSEYRRAEELRRRV